MKERAKNFLTAIVCGTVFTTSVIMTVTGNSADGMTGVLLSLAGLGLILALLHFYNSSYK